MRMEFFALIGLITVVVFIFKKLTRPTNSDKLTLLQLENWIPMYANGSFLEKSNMATALVVQAITVAKAMGIDISVNEVMAEKNKENISSIQIVDQWLDYIHSVMSKDVAISQLNPLPARTVFAMVIVHTISRSKFGALLRGGA